MLLNMGLGNGFFESDTKKKKKKKKCNESRNKQDFQKDILSIPFKLFQKIQETKRTALIHSLRSYSFCFSFVLLGGID